MICVMPCLFAFLTLPSGVQAVSVTEGGAAGCSEAAAGAAESGSTSGVQRAQAGGEGTAAPAGDLREAVMDG